MTDAQIAEAAHLFGVLAEPARLLILRTLMEGPMSVGELVDSTGLKQANASKHLGVLQRARFIACRRQGNFAIYRILDPRLKQLCTIMCQRIAESAGEQARVLRA